MLICKVNGCPYRNDVFCGKRDSVILENGVCKELTNKADGFHQELVNPFVILNVVKQKENTERLPLNDERNETNDERELGEC